MPPIIHLIRHAEGEHNEARDATIQDAVLTAKGKGQCRVLQSEFPYHDDIDIVFVSPLRRTIQTAALSLGPTLARKEVSFVLLPELQEVSNNGCDVGLAMSAEDIKQLAPGLFEEGELDFNMEKMDASAVTAGWNSKQDYWAFEKQAICTRAGHVRNFLFQRGESQIVLVTHGAFAHFLAEDRNEAEPMTRTAYKNCEHREFVFTAGSTTGDAHIVETLESRMRRGARAVC